MRPLSQLQLLRLGGNLRREGAIFVFGVLNCCSLEGAPGATLRLGSGALLWRASDLANVARVALGHHLEALFRARFPGEGSRHEALGVQEFISKAIEEIQVGRVLQGDRRLPRGGAHYPSEGKEFHVCNDILGQGRVSAAHVAVSCRPMRGTASQLRPHAFRPGRRG